MSMKLTLTIYTFAFLCFIPLLKLTLFSPNTLWAIHTSAFGNSEEVTLEAQVTRVAEVIIFQGRENALESLPLLSRPHCGEDVATSSEGDGNGCLSNTATTRMDQHTVAFADSTPDHQSVVSSAVHDRDGSSFRHAPRIWYLPQELSGDIHCCCHTLVDLG